jgi:hypothetical protein
MSQNPLELIHDTFWDLLEGSTAFCTLVPNTKNRIKYYGGLAQPEKPEVGPADAPEVRVIPTGYEAAPFSDSDRTGIRVKFAVQVYTGRQEISRLLQIVWAVFCAMHNWDTAMETLTWNGKVFAHSCRLYGGKDSKDNQELNRGIKGWANVFEGEIDCVFDIDDLRTAGGT